MNIGLATFDCKEGIRCKSFMVMSFDSLNVALFKGTQEKTFSQLWEENKGNATAFLQLVTDYKMSEKQLIGVCAFVGKKIESDTHFYGNSNSMDIANKFSSFWAWTPEITTLGNYVNDYWVPDRQLKEGLLELILAMDK